MPDENVADTAVPASAGAGPRGPQRRVIEESVADNELSSREVSTSVVSEQHSDAPQRRKLPKTTEDLLDKLGAPPPDPDVGDEVPGEAAPPAPEPAAAKPADKPAEEKKPAEPAKAPPELDAIRGERDRLLEHNRRLAGELDVARRAPQREPNDRDKALDELERGYFDDSIGSIRRLIALAFGVAPDAKQVDEELSGLYTDLTARELGVPLDKAHKAARDAARATHLLARDKRERKAETDAKANAPVSDDAAITDTASYIERAHLGELGEQYPYLKMAQKMDGMPPSTLLARVMQRDLRAGVFDEATLRDDRKMLAITAKTINDHYRAVLEEFSSIKPKDPAQAGAATAGQETKTRQGEVAQPITNASASVAPATPPPAPSDPAPKKYKTAAEHREALLDRYFPKS